MENLETHLIDVFESTGDNYAPRLFMDNIKSLFASKMIYSSNKQGTISNNQVWLAETSINETCEKYPI